MVRRFRGPAAGVAAVLLAAAALALVPASAASAHDYLVASTPAAGSTVSTPLSTVSLTFDAAVLDLGRGRDEVAVTGPGSADRHYETACATVADRTVTAAVSLGAPGEYTVAWRIISADGHPVTDSIRFTYAPPSGTTAAAGTASGPACGAGVAAGQGPAAAGGSGGGSLAVLVLGVSGAALLLVIAVVVVVVVLLRRSDRQADPAGPDEPARPGG